MDGFLLLIAAPDRLQALLSATPLGRQWLSQQAPHALRPDLHVLNARLQRGTPPWRLQPLPFSSLHWHGRSYAEPEPAKPRQDAPSQFLAGLRRHGRAWQGRLNGEYSWCLLDPDRLELQAGADLCGHRSVFHGVIDGVQLCSSSAAVVPALFPDLVIDAVELARYLRPFAPTSAERGGSFYRDLKLLRAGEWLQVDLRTGAREISLLPPPPQLLAPLGLPRQQLEQHFRQQWQAALADRVGSAGAVMTLSGGIDSALLALGLSELRDSGGRSGLRVQALHSVLQGELGRQEQAVAASVASALGLELECMQRDPGPPAWPVSSWVAMADQPLGMSDDLAQLRRLVALGGPGLSGMGADELLATAVRRPGLHRSLLPRLERGLRRRLRGVAALAAPSAPPPDPDLAAIESDRAPSWVRSRWHEVYAAATQAPQRQQPSAWWSLLWPNEGYRCDLEAVDSEGICVADLSQPFMDFRVLRCLLDPLVAQQDLDRCSRAPPKQFLRGLLRQRLPPSVWRRRKQAAGQPQFARIAAMDAERMRQQMASVEGLADLLDLERLPAPRIDSPWRTIYAWSTCMSLTSWWVLQSGVKAQWAISRM